MKAIIKLLLPVFMFFLPFSTYAQSPFDQFDFLIGSWQGVEKGMAGDGIGFRTYQYELNKNFIFEKNMSTFPITDKKPRGEVHRDFGVISYNKNDSSIVFRQFHVEGFANIYKLDKNASGENKFVFVTREIENNPGNWAARLIVDKVSDTEFRETFEIAMDGKNFSHFLKNHWKKE
ncbi:hypothetical protein QQ008_25565 [Fulvivirgaceae bacterium BMA10]|uniref:DUF1579 domain-containing protein n=1 Tax=Splendidivirga corallicola TaxID=3051826 RepID=A0ABT8KVI3_9BACT|nr:hypothetical protein [Fulvivirgaceae bacterium BMA10]